MAGDDMGSERHAVALVATEASQLHLRRPILVGMAAASAHQQQLWLAPHGMSQQVFARCHGRLPCAEAVSAAISSSVTSSAPSAHGR